jgi:tetratricopeptide (TPR) repeat protein
MSEKTAENVEQASERDRLQLIVSMATSGDLESASRLASTMRNEALACEAWVLLSRINANSQRFDAARATIEIALQHQPASPVLHFERAILMEQQGLEPEALVEFEALEREFGENPRLLVPLARVQASLGRASEAEARIEAALMRWPLDVPLHYLLAQLRWQRGAGKATTRLLEQAIAEHPQELQLRLVAADVLRNAGFAQQALQLLEDGLKLAPASPTFLTSVGVLLDALDRPVDALPYLQAAVTRSQGEAQPKRNLLPTLLRLDAAAEALQICDTLIAQAPDDQQLIAYRATALRMLGDAGYSQLHDYERLVRIYRPRAPEGFSDIAAFNAEFARELLRLHGSAQRPLAQSLRGGSQTDRNLPGGHPLVAAFFSLIDAPIRDYIAHLRNEHRGHPTDRRRCADYRLAGSWSVQLQPGGFHVNHVHPQGWLSSAYYVELPGDPGDDATRAGWLKFGEPGMPLAACPADHFVKPEAGMLVLFPSYLWHGTVPFESGGRRLTAAFEVLPA